MKFVSSATITALLTISAAASAHAAALTDAVAWWQFEGTTDDSTTPTSSTLTSVLPTQGGMTAGGNPQYSAVSGLSASNAGSQAFTFDGGTVLKSADTSLRISGAQTLWIRVKFSTISSDLVTLLSRHRGSDSQRGIALTVNNGRIVALASQDGNSGTQVQAYNSSSMQLSANTWYDISLRYLPSTSDANGILRYDVYDPQTGNLLTSLTQTNNVPSSILATNSIGSGYFQLGSTNNGSGGSAWLVPSGTQVEAAAVWNNYLSDSDLAKLSAIPEPASLGLLGLGALCLLKRAQ